MPDDTHWLQFGTSHVYGADGKEIKVRHEVTLDDQIVKRITGRTYLDCGHLPSDRIPPYYSSSPGSTIRKKNELSIFDKPGMELNKGEIGVMEFQSFLVSRGKVYYQVDWKIAFEWKNGKLRTEYKDVIGKKVTGLPEQFWGDELEGGFYPKDGKNVDCIYKNPIPKENRKFAFGE